MEEISDIKRDFNINKMCRTCLLETDDEMHEIFGNSQPDALTLNLNQVLLQVSANIQVNEIVGGLIVAQPSLSLTSRCVMKPCKLLTLFLLPFIADSTERRIAR